MKALTLLTAVAVLGSSPGTVSAKSPVVVELFTAQGCASCKQANGLLAKLADSPGVIALTWSVDYWDYLGWKDTFAQPGYTARQKAFDRRLGPPDVYTPQVVINGAAQMSGDDAAGVEELIAKGGAAHRPGPKLRVLADGHVRIGPGAPPRVPADVWLIRFDPKAQDVEVKAGDNRGMMVALKNVVRQTVRLGSWAGRAVTFSSPPSPAKGLAGVVLVQGARGGAILAATRVRPTSR